MNHESVEFDASDVEPEVTALIGQLGALCEKHELPFVVSVLYRRKFDDDGGSNTSFTGGCVLQQGKAPLEHYAMQAILEGEIEAAIGGCVMINERGGMEVTTETL